MHQVLHGLRVNGLFFQFLILGYRSRIGANPRYVTTFQFLILGYRKASEAPLSTYSFQFLILGYRTGRTHAHGSKKKLSIPHFRIRGRRARGERENVFCFQFLILGYPRLARTKLDVSSTTFNSSF